MPPFRSASINPKWQITGPLIIITNHPGQFKHLTRFSHSIERHHNKTPQTVAQSFLLRVESFSFLVARVCFPQIFCFKWLTFEKQYLIGEFVGPAHNNLNSKGKFDVATSKMNSSWEARVKRHGFQLNAMTFIH